MYIDKIIILYLAFLLQFDFLAGFLGLSTGIVVMYSILFGLVLFPKKWMHNNRNEVLFKFYILSIIAFLLFGLISIVWSRAPFYGLTKLAIFAIKFFSILLCSKLLFQNIKFFSICSLFVSFILLGAILVQFGSPVSLLFEMGKFDRFGDTDNSNPIVVGRFFGMISILYFWYITKNNLGAHTKTILLVVFLVSTLYTFLSGSKGPLFSLFFVVVIYLLVNIRYTIKPIIFSLLFTVLIVSTSGKLNEIIKDVNESEFFIDRYLENSDSYDSRFEIITDGVVNGFKKSRFSIITGFGSGDYGYLTFNQDKPMYPHNLFIEIIYEFGLIGLLFLIPVFIIFTKKIYVILRKDNITLLFGLYSVYFLVNSMVSGDISNNVYFFLFTGLMIIKLNDDKEDLFIPKAHAFGNY